MPEGGCFGQGLQINTTSSILQFNGSSLHFTSLPSSYTFHLYISKLGRDPASTTQTLTLVPGNPPLIELSCHTNCGLYINPTQKLALRSQCMNCEQGEALDYLWSFVPGSTASIKQHMDWDTETYTGRRKSNLVVAAGVFSMVVQESYSFELQGLFHSLITC